MTIHFEIDSLFREKFTIFSKSPLHFAAVKGHVEVANDLQKNFYF